MEDNVAIVANNLVKYFGSKAALRGVSFKIRFGEVYGLLGPNGAGKTTTLRIVMGILRPDSGDVRVLGYSSTEQPEVVKSLVGYVPEEIHLYNSLTVSEFFEFVSNVRGVEDGWEVASKLAYSLDIAEYWETPIAALSQGTKQKVAIIAALIHRPKILVLDEPIKGLDAKSARIVKEIIMMHKRNGGAVLFSTHIMDIAESICDRIGIIHEGVILAEGTMDELRELAGGEKSLEEVFLILTKERGEVSEIIKELEKVFSNEKS